MENTLRPQHKILLHSGLQPRENDIAEALRSLHVHDARGNKLKIPSQPISDRNRKLWGKKARFLSQISAAARQKSDKDIVSTDGEEETEMKQETEELLDEKELQEEMFFMMAPSDADIAHVYAKQQPDKSKSQIHEKTKEEEEEEEETNQQAKPQPNPPVFRTVMISVVRKQHFG